MIQTTSPIIQSLAALAAGVTAGLAYFALLERTVTLYLGGAPVAAVALQAARFLLAGVVLFGAVQFGATALLSCALGFLIGRHVVLRRAGRQP